MSDFRERLIDEYTELTERIKKLNDFMVTSDFTRLSQEDRVDLKAQRIHMKAYHEVLMRRTSRLCGY